MVKSHWLYVVVQIRSPTCNTPKKLVRRFEVFTGSTLKLAVHSLGFNIWGG